MTKKTVSPIKVYTDGACSKNGTCNAKGGIGVYFGPQDSRNVSKPLPLNAHRHTNQRAELTAIKTALEVTRSQPNRQVVIHTDSKYGADCVNTWLPRWKITGYKKAGGGNVKNRDIIEKLSNLIDERGPGKVSVKHVRGHAGILQNEQADKLAKRAIGK